MNILTLLLILPLIVFIIVLVFIVKYKLYNLPKRKKTDKERILVEDSLKHIFDCEHNKSICSYETLSKYLSVSKISVEKLLGKLIETGLINKNTDAIILTEKGREYALKVIRIHRLLEKYFSDETSESADIWHSKAEKHEHYISIEDAEKLSVKMGNPLYDPHGDPIPTKDGFIPQKEEISINRLNANERGELSHFEDEPKSVYSEIVNCGLEIGMKFQVLKREDKQITIICNNEEIALSKELANNIFVKPINSKEEINLEIIALSNIKIGEKVKVYLLSKSLRGQQRRRIMDMGIVPGTIISPTLESLGKDPIGYLVRNTIVALRKQQANQIFVRRMEANG